MKHLTKENERKLHKLTFNFIHATSIQFDWSEGYGDTWHIMYPDVFSMDDDERAAYIDDYGIDVNDYSEATLIEHLQDEILNDPKYQPMMNYYTDMGNADVSDMVTLFADSCYTVIQFDDESIGLALTGGGMDMRWSMAKAFVKAGFLPPGYICDLPHLAGHDDALIIAACNEALVALANAHLRTVGRNNDILK